jgi:FMN phosphatase YigB (HAD superfamily)
MKFRSYVSVLLLFVQMYSALCLASPRTTSSMKEALSEVEPDTLVLVDIDSTLFHSIDGVGSNRWFRQLTREAISLGVRGKLLTKVIQRVFDQLNNHSRLWLIEENTPDILNNLVIAGIRLHALTARDPEMIPFTLAQMHSLGIVTSRDSVNDISRLGHGVLMSDGVIFSTGSRKGRALALFLDKTRIQPRKIVIIDDSAENLVDVELEAGARGIPVQAWRYVARKNLEPDGRFNTNPQKGSRSNSLNATLSVNSPFSTHISRSRVRSIICEQLFTTEN